MNSRSEVIATLDLGTTKVVVLVAEVSASGVTVLGVGVAECEGLRKGSVVSIGKTVEAILKAKHDAEQMSGCEITEVIAGVGGPHVVGVNNHGLVTTKGSEIGKADVVRALEAASVLNMPLERVLVNVIPTQYVVDEHDGIRDPVGMSGKRLEVEAHLITGVKTALDNIEKCANRSGLRVREFVANPLASALAVLEDNERELGVVTLDLGGGCGDLTIWLGGRLIHTCVLGAGGEVITADIATGLRTPKACAERLKIEYGAAYSAMVSDGETIEVPGVGGRPKNVLSRHHITMIIEARMVEIFGLVQREIRRFDIAELLAGGLVITGGAARMPGIAELGDSVLNLPVRIGKPRDVKGLTSLLDDPALSTAYGLAVYGAIPWLSRIPWPMQPVRRLRKSKGFFGWLRRAASVIF